MNSLELMNFNESFDLIWIDGDHSYPIAAIDIANSIRLLSPAGAAICDDVYLKANEKNENGRSKASISSLEAHVDAKLVEFSLIHKRIGVFFNYPPSNKKYLGFVTRKVYS
jgi:predicted O-methyltransferase YrrM